MAGQPTRKLAVILHADVVGSTRLVQLDETLAHKRIQDAFQRFSGAIGDHNGTAHEIRGDALVAEFARVSDAISATLVFQAGNAAHNEEIADQIRPVVRAGVAMGEVVVADNTVTGEGVVLAQRLEQLATEGGLCIQGAAYEAVPKRLPFSYENLGKHQVKGFDEPVRVYAVRLKPDAVIPEPEALIQPNTATTPDLPDKPPIAVLPFTNMSGDPEQEYFSDGITEDVITALSRVSGLLVVARNSTMAYKGKTVDVKQVGKEQGVQYVLEGSVRKSGSRIRVTAQLIDAITGHHQWAQRYDRDLTDIFVVQDEITHQITVEMRVQLREGEQVRMWAGGTNDVRAWELVFRATELKDREIYEDNLEGRRLAEEALRIDPGYARGWVVLGVLHWNDAFWEWAESREDSLSKSLEAAEKALQEDYPDALVLLAHIYRLRGEHDRAVEVARKAVSLAPNHSENTAMLAVILTCAGIQQEAIEKFKRAMRLSPVYPAWYLVLFGACYYSMGKLDLAISTLKQAIEKEPDSAFARVWIACAFIEAGLEEDAKLAAQNVIRIDPKFTASDFQGAEFKDPKVGEKIVQNLLRAGLTQ